MRLLLSLCVLLSFCLSALAQPYLYVSFHGSVKNGVNNVYAYDLQGNLVNQNVLTGPGADQAKGLRSMLLQQDGTLLVANSDDNNGVIWQFGRCDETNSRPYLNTFANVHLDHAYGLAKGYSGPNNQTTVWATNQDSYDLVAFDGQGNFVTVVRNFGSEELRSIAFDDATGYLYVTNEDENKVLVYDTVHSQWMDKYALPFGDPIGLFIDTEARLLWVGSHTDNAVHIINLDTRQTIQTLTSPGLSHPAGIVAYQDSTYVISQDDGTVVQFNSTDGTLISTLISSFPDTPEQLILSPC